MEKTIKTFGRTELAQIYFPRLCPEAAWHKLRSWLKINPRLYHLYELTRRTFTPAEVRLIYAELGEPWSLAAATKIKWHLISNKYHPQMLIETLAIQREPLFMCVSTFRQFDIS